MVQGEPARLVVSSDDGAQEVGRHHGCQHARHHQRGKHRQRCRPAKLLEKLAGNAAHEGGWQEHGNQREGGGNHGQADLVGCFHRRLVRRLAHAQMAHDVLHFNDRIVHQNPHHQGERQQRHHVDGETHLVHADEGGNGRHRQRHRRHQRGAPLAQEQPHHQHRQRRALVQQMQGADVFLLRRRHKVKGQRQFHVRVLQLELFQGFLYGCAYRHFALAAAAHHFKTDHRHAVEQGGGARLGHRVADAGHVAQADAPAVGQREFDQRHLSRAAHRAQGSHRLLGHAQIGATASGLGLHHAQLA